MDRYFLSLSVFGTLSQDKEDSLIGNGERKDGSCIKWLGYIPNRCNNTMPKTKHNVILDEFLARFKEKVLKDNKCI